LYKKYTSNLAVTLKSPCHCIYYYIDGFFLQLLAVRNELKNKPPLLVKVSPDLSQQEKEDVATVVCSEEVSLYS